jgi:hypothetical protein
MTRVHLCGGPALLVVEVDGILYYRRPGQPDTRVPYAPEHYGIFLSSARHKHDLIRVVGPCGEEAPALPGGKEIPELRQERLSSGEAVYRMMPEVPAEGEIFGIDGAPAKEGQSVS